MKFNDLKFVNGICQLDYNYYVLSFTKQGNQKLFECSVFNRAKLPVDLPGVKTEKIITGIKTPKHLEYSEFYKNIF